MPFAPTYFKINLEVFILDFFNHIDWMLIIRCFAIGGLLCVIGQILIDKTKLTSARILVIFVTTGAILRRSAGYIKN